jgi:hypothetical protein
MNHTSPIDADTRYLELADLVDGLVQSMERTSDDRGTAQILTTLADAARELAELSA